MKRYYKAVAAFLTAAAGAISTVYADGKVTAPEAVVGVITVAVATMAVYQVKNEPAA